MRTRIYEAAAVLLAVTAAAGSARADKLAANRDEYGKITRISRGVFELGLDAMLLVAYDQQEEESTFRSTALGGGRFRWFFADNTSLDVMGAGFYKGTGEVQTDVGAVGALGVSRFMRLGQGMFFAPGISAGVLFGTRSIDVGNGTSLDSGLLGFSGTIELPLVFYAWQRLNVRAGPTFRLAAGTASPDQGDGVSFLSVDGGFAVGIGYFY